MFNNRIDLYKKVIKILSINNRYNKKSTLQYL